MKYAFYSKTADEERGHAVYRRADGTEVVTTGVCDDPGGECYKWPDKEFLGEVLSVQEGGFVRSAHHGQPGPKCIRSTDYDSTTPHLFAAFGKTRWTEAPDSNPIHRSLVPSTTANSIRMRK